MLRAVPITVRIADSRLVVLRSTSLIFAISSTCFFVTLPTLLRFGSAEPFAMFAARFSRTDAGGVFRMKVKVRSVYTVTSTGKIIPSGSLAVLALNCLQKSMMFKPCGPSAVPTGGAGVALPAGNCSLIVVDLFDAAVEIRKGAIHDAHLLVALEDHFRLRAVLRGVDAIDDSVHFRFAQRRR